MASSLSPRTVGGAAWTVAGSTAQAVVSIVTVAVLARLIPPEGFGAFAAAMAILRAGETFAQLGLDAALVQRPQLTKAHHRAAFTLLILAAAVTASSIALGSDVLARAIGLSSVGPLLTILSLALPAAALGRVSESLLRRDLELRALALARVASTALVFSPTAIVMAAKGHGALSLVVAQVASDAAHSALLLVARRHALKPLLSRPIVADLVRFGGGMTLARLGTYVATEGDKLLVGRLLGGSALGVYSRALGLVMAPVDFVGNLATRVLFPALSRAKRDGEDLALAYRRGAALALVTLAPIALAVLVLAPWIIAVFLGSAWHDAIGPLRMLGAAMFLRGAFLVLSNVAKASGAVYAIAWRYLLHGAVVLLCVALGSRYGAQGAAAGVTLAMALRFALLHALCMRLLHVPVRVVVVDHLQALPLLILTVALAAATAGIAELYPLPSVVVLSLFTAAWCSLVLLATWLSPRFFLGESGHWLALELLALAPHGSRAHRLRARLAATASARGAS